MERGSDRIRLESKDHGQYECQAADLDKIIDNYGHMTLGMLRAELEERQGVPYSISTRTEGFMILAELLGYATN